MASKYDPAEALQVMAVAQGGLVPTAEVRDAAAKELFAALVALNGQHGFTVKKAPVGNTVIIVRPSEKEDEAATITYAKGAFTWRRPLGDSSPPLPLECDVISRKWVGPRGIRPDGKEVRRTALAVIIGAVLEGWTDEHWRALDEQ